MTDNDGNTRKTVENGVNPDGNNGVYANDDVFSQGNGEDTGANNGNNNKEENFTSSVQQSSSSYTTTTDDDGNTNTVGDSSSMSGVVNGNQVNDNGNVYGSQSVQTTRNNSTMEGKNGQYDVKTDQSNLDEQKSKNADGQTSYENHYSETRNV